ncbi:MAG: hypothetical protein ACF8QF_05250 [Phycisphaerales bacterium]
MHEVKRLLRRAAWRVGVGRFVGFLALTLTIAIACLGVALGLERLFGVGVVWSIALWSALAGALALGVALTIWKWPREDEVARLVDERAALRESLSTAVCVADRADAWSRAAVEHAARMARGVALGRALPATAPRLWPAPLTAAAIVGALWLTLPQADLLGLLSKAEAEERREEERADAVAQVRTAQDEVRKALEQVGEADLFEDLQTPETEEADPEQIRRMALRELTSLNERLEQRRAGSEAMKMEELRDRLSRLEEPGEGPLDDVAEALAQGEFAKAGEALRQMMEQLQAGEMSDAQREALAKQLENLAEQIEQLAQDRKALEQKLAEQGIDPSLLDNPMGLREAIQNAEGLSEQQKQQLQQTAQGQEGAQDLMQQMAKSMQQAAGECKNPGQQGQQGQQSQQQGGSPGEQGQQASPGMGQLSDQLSQMEMLQQEMQGLQAAQQQVWGQMSDLSSALGEDPGAGQGEPNMLELWDRRSGGNRGAGGGLLSQEQADFTLRQEKAVGQDHGGAPIATRMVEGAQVRGESVQAFGEAVSSGSQSAADAIESQRIPREYHDAVKHYFGRLEAKAKAERARESTPPPPPAESGEGESGDEGR